jgi:hypothetical protein
VVQELVKVGADVNLQSNDGYTPLIAACKRGHVSVIQELVNVGADVNLQSNDGYTPLSLTAAVTRCPLSIVRCLVEHGDVVVTRVVDVKMSAVYRALILNKPDIVKYLIQEQNKLSPGKFTGNSHLFNCLVDIRHAGVTTDSRDDVVVTDRSVWCMDGEGDVWRTISRGDCDVLRHLLCVGLDVNQSIQLYDSDSKSDVRPLLYRLIDERYVIYRVEKVRMLLGAGADVIVRVRCREYDSVLDREGCRAYDSVLDRVGVSVLERTRRLVCQYSNSEYWFDRYYRVPKYKKLTCDIKKYVRRHSV